MSYEIKKLGAFLWNAYLFKDGRPDSEFKVGDGESAEIKKAFPNIPPEFIDTIRQMMNDREFTFFKDDRREDIFNDEEVRRLFRGCRGMPFSRPIQPRRFGYWGVCPNLRGWIGQIDSKSGIPRQPLFKLFPKYALPFLAEKKMTC